MKSDIYLNPVLISKNIEIKAQAYRNGVPFSPVYSEKLIMHKTTGKPYRMDNVNPSYSGGHPYALTDGIVAKSNAWNRWVGTLGKDMDVQIDLLDVIAVRKVSMQFFNSPDSWIYGPTEVIFYTSENGKDWTMIDKKTWNPEEYKTNGLKDVVFQKSLTTRYIRIVAKSIGKIPQGAQGEGNDAHLFCNEIVVE